MVRCSLIIAGHNEGERLCKTVQSCVETCSGLDYEIVIADDASTDGSVENAIKRFPQVRVMRHPERLGASPTKDAGARIARGNVLVFLDGHVKPEPGAIARFVEDIEMLDGKAIVTPTVAGLDPTTWRNSPTAVGNGYTLELATFQTRWIPLNQLRPRQHGSRRFYESPALIGCACAVSRELYDQLWGFDRQMFCWGLEDVDFGLKSWLMGYSILHDPEIRVGHRFQEYLTGYSVSWPAVIVNQLRTARKHLSESLWRQWVERCRLRYPQTQPDVPEGIWTRAWLLFQEQRASVEAERAHLLGHRVRDEFWFADRFGLPWPKLREAAPSSVALNGRQQIVARNENQSDSVNRQSIWGSEAMSASPQVHEPMDDHLHASNQKDGGWSQSIWGAELMSASPQVHEPTDDHLHGSSQADGWSQSIWGAELMSASPQVHEPAPEQLNGDSTVAMSLNGGVH